MEQEDLRAVRLGVMGNEKDFRIHFVK
jgi:hypothetical protein